MFISVCIIAYNEEKTLAGILADIEEQDYPHEQMELLLVDSASTDGTRRIMQDFAEKNKAAENALHFRSVRVLDNPKRTLPCGWNVALSAYEGEAILKVDAHASIPPDFVRKNAALLDDGEDIAGGQRPNIVDEPTPWRNTLLLAESSMFGSSIAPYRNNPGKTYVSSLFHAAYRRRVFEAVGGFDERLARTEDNEIHYRMRKAGFKLAFDPSIISYQHTRSSLRKMLRQKYANGYWIGLTTGVCAQCFSLYHFVPFAFVLAIILSGIGLSVLGLWAASYGGIADFAAFIPAGAFLFRLIAGLTVLMWSLYGLLAVGMALLAVFTAGEKRNWTCIALPFLFLLLHVCYGAGTLAGLIKMPRWLKGIKEENGRNQKR